MTHIAHIIQLILLIIQIIIIYKIYTTNIFDTRSDYQKKRDAIDKKFHYDPTPMIRERAELKAAQSTTDDN